MDNLQVLTVEQVAESVQLSVSTVMRAIAAGDLEASQLTRSRGGWRVRESAIADWMNARSNRSRRRPSTSVHPIDPPASLGTPRRVESPAQSRIAV
jgi:excisionase family DNA binding protein